MKHELLLELRVEHAGPPARPCTGLEIHPGVAGARLLARHKLLARPRPGGLDVIGVLDAHDRPLIELRGLTLTFELVPRDPELALRSDLEPLQRLAHPIFRRARSGSTLRPHVGTAPLPRGVLAGVEIGGVSSTWLRTPRRFVVSLPERPLHWVYYVVSRRADVAPRVADADRARALGFTVERLVGELLAGDPVGAALVARHPDRAVYRLSSDRPPPAAAMRGLALRFGESTLLSHLPAPSVHHHTSLRTPGAKPRDAIYRVLET